MWCYSIKYLVLFSFDIMDLFQPKRFISCFGDGGLYNSSVYGAVKLQTKHDIKADHCGFIMTDIFSCQ